MRIYTHNTNPRYENPPLGKDKWGRCICNHSMNKDEPRHDSKICECECHLTKTRKCNA